MVKALYPFGDFEAIIRIYGSAEGGRRTPAFNGIRWDFSYAEDQPVDTLYLIWPDFLGVNGESLPTDQPLPLNVELSARMTIVSDEMRAEVHRVRIRPRCAFLLPRGQATSRRGRR